VTGPLGEKRRSRIKIRRIKGRNLRLGNRTEEKGKGSAGSEKDFRRGGSASLALFSAVSPAKVKNGCIVHFFKGERGRGRSKTNTNRKPKTSGSAYKRKRGGGIRWKLLVVASRDRLGPSSMSREKKRDLKRITAGRGVAKTALELHQPKVIGSATTRFRNKQKGRGEKRNNNDFAKNMEKKKSGEVISGSRFSRLFYRRRRPSEFKIEGGKGSDSFPKGGFLRRSNGFSPIQYYWPARPANIISMGTLIKERKDENGKD